MVQMRQNSWMVMNCNYRSSLLQTVLMNLVYCSWAEMNGIFKPNIITVLSCSVPFHPIFFSQMAISLMPDGDFWGVSQSVCNCQTLAPLAHVSHCGPRLHALAKSPPQLESKPSYFWFYIFWPKTICPKDILAQCFKVFYLRDLRMFVLC